MTPKEEANKLINKFYYTLPNNGSINDGINSCTSRYNEAIECALIAVNVILKNFGTLTEGKQHYAAHCTVQHYEETKQWIQKIKDQEPDAKLTFKEFVISQQVDIPADFYDLIAHRFWDLT
jgi:hypothetical protein